jgi:hypothetical protein
MDSKDIALIDIPTKGGRLKASGYVTQFSVQMIDDSPTWREPDDDFIQELIREPVRKIILELTILPGMEMSMGLDEVEVVKLPIGRILT